MKKAVIYCRVSTKKQSLGNGLDRQEDCCKEYALKNNYEIIQIFREIGSAYHGGKKVKLPLRKEATNLAKQEQAVLIFEDWDRYSRDFCLPWCEHVSVYDKIFKRKGQTEFLLKILTNSIYYY